jgi:phosphopantetheine adenylyltransferase
MFIDFLLSNFEIFIFLSILFIVVAFILLFLLQLQNFQSNKNSIIEYAQIINNTSKEIKEYLIVVGNLLEHQKKEILNISEKIVFIEREINRLGNIKGSEDVLNVAINMVRQGNSKEEIINKTGLREDEVEAIYTYYKK